jgi:outer membrane cobalamin receptor
MKLTNTRRSLSPAVLAGLCLLPVLNAIAEEKPNTLEAMIVSALRTPREASTVTSAVTALDPAALENQGILQLRDALNASPGVISTSTGGQTGAIGSLFIRGTRTADSQVVIDGMRLSDSNSPLGNLLSGSRTYDVGSIEVLRGPQGAIYGGESIGGVLWMETPRGSGDPHGSATFEAGSFDSAAARAMFQGEIGKLSYHLSGGYEETDNDGPNQHFHQGNTALRVEGKVDSIWTVGSTFRSIDSFYQNAGGYETLYGSDDHLDSALATIYANGRISDRWTARFLAGYHQESYDSDYLDAWAGTPANYGSDLKAFSVSTDHEITLAENLRLLTGAFLHQDSYQVTNGVDESGDRYGIHSVLEWEPIESLTTTAALRWEDYDSYGDELTWRFGSVYRLEKSGTSFRAGAGRSFRAPSYTDLFYDSPSYDPNPSLEAQNSVGWDLGIEQKIGERHVLEVTWFSNHIEDAINSYSDPEGDYIYTAENIPGRTTTDGLELGLRGNWLENTLNYRLAWTWLHRSLSDQPRNAVTAALDWKPVDKALIGIGATHLSSHSWGGDPLESYTLLRIHGSYQLTDHVKLHARVENLLDEQYELFSGYGSTIEGAGTGFYAGLTIDW